MSEYLEAISRLEAPERPPRVQYIKRIPFGDYPNYKTTKIWNKVFSDGRFSKLPKYSIPQRFYITKNELGRYVYDFVLDKTFTTAIGDRKSIAIRGINFKHKLKEVDVQLHTKFETSNGDTYYVDGSKQTFGLEYPITEKIQTIFTQQQLLDTLTLMIVETFKALFPTIEDLIDGYSYDVETSRIVISLNHITQGSDESKWSFKVHIKAYNNNSIHLFDTNITTRITPAVVDDDTNHKITLTYDLSSYIVKKIDVPQSVCSTINPYSVQNIIGSLEEKHDMLNKIFPYDRHDTFQLWFNDNDGNRMKNDFITGYLDLELIVDNGNNFSLET